jgi:hypothetical protein
LVTEMPPSPAGRFLLAWKEKIPMSRSRRPSSPATGSRGPAPRPRSRGDRAFWRWPGWDPCRRGRRGCARG